MRGDGANHHGKLGLEGISCESQFTIPEMAGTSPNQGCNSPDRTSCQQNQASRTPDFSYLHISATSFSFSSPISLFLVHNFYYHYRTQSEVIHLYLCIIWLWFDTEYKYTPSTASTEYSIHRVQHTPSTAYTEYSIHRVQHTLSTVYTQYSIPKSVWLPFIFKITNWPLNIASAPSVPPYMIGCLQRARPESSKIKSPCYIPTFASQLTDEKSLSTRCAVHRPPPSTCSISLHHSLRSESPNTLDYSLQAYLETRLMMTFKCISKYAWLLPPRASLNWLDHGLWVYLWVYSIINFRRILNWFQAPAAVCPDILCVDV